MRRAPGIAPHAIQGEEIVYVDQLRQVYGEAAGAAFACADDVLAHPDHGEHLRRQRTRFFEAASFSRFHRDNTAPGALTTFKNDVYYGVIEVYHETHASRLQRVDAVMKHAGQTQVSLLGRLTRIPVRQGMCHHLANEGLLKDPVRADDFGDLFNSRLEAGIRAVVVLELLRPETADLSEMVLFDHV